MARFLTSAWVEELNAALDGVPLPDLGPDAGLAMADGRVVVVQEVHGTPDGDVRLVMRIESGTVRLSLADRIPAGPRWRGRGTGSHGDHRPRLRGCRSHGPG